MLGTFFILITLATVYLLWRVFQNNKIVLVYSSIWLILIGVLAYQGIFENVAVFPPRIFFVFIINILLIVGLVWKINPKPLDIRKLTEVHLVRIPVEITLYALAVQKLIPHLMSFTGWNYDIFMGISALLLLLLSRKTDILHHPKVMLAWNVLGVILLVTIIGLAILSAPLPFQKFAFDQPNIGLLMFPFIYLPSFVAPAVLFIHLLTIKKILKSL